MNKIIEIARFESDSEAAVAGSLLEAGGIEYFLRDKLMNQVYGGISAIGGIKLDILDDNLSRALEILKEGGYGEYITWNEE